MDELLPIVIFTGVFSGYFLALIAPEELRDGQYYFEVFTNICLSLFVLIFSLALTGSFYIAPALAIGLFLLLYKLRYPGVVYIISGASLFFIEKPDHLLFAGIFLFLAGMGLASITAVQYEKNEQIKQKMQLLNNTVKHYGWFILISLLPFLFSYL